MTPAPAQKLTGGLTAGDLNFVRGKGAYCWDDSGHMHLDLVSGYGSVVLGHGDPVVVDRVAIAARDGNYLYGRHTDVQRLKERLLSAYPGSTEALFFKTGSEAVQAAVRLARATTGKQRILRCGFHGWHDQFMAEDVSWHRYHLNLLQHESVSGVPPSMRSLTTAVACDLAAIRRAMSEHDDVAALILDPVQVSEPIGKTLREIADECRSRSVLLVVDEAKTGFRIARGGVQERYSTYGDITVLSKAIANGFPLAAVLHSSTVDSKRGNLKLMGTFNHELTAIAAALATWDVMESKNGWTQLEQTGQALIDAVNACLLERGWQNHVSLVPYRWPSMPYFLWRNERRAREMEQRLAAWLTQSRVLWLPNHMNFVSLAHGSAEIQQFCSAVAAFCESEGCPA